MTTFPEIVLKPGKEKKVRNFAPWIYRDEVARVDRNVERMGKTGGIVVARDAGGGSVAKGWFTPGSRVAMRVLTRDLAEDVDLDFFVRRIDAAMRLRDRHLPGEEGVRLVHAEADDLPGIVVDAYAGHLVAQLRYAGADAFRPLITQALERVVSPKGIYERSDMPARTEEGLEVRVGPLAGQTPAEVEFREGGARFVAQVAGGHKTGFYLDQRDNRAMLCRGVSAGERVLDAFASTGSISTRLALAGAQCVAVEKDPAAAAAARAHAERNGVATRIEVRTADAFEEMPSLAASGARFDRVILDPPAIAKRREELPTARWAFVTLSTAALRLLVPGGTLFVSSCAYHLTASLLEETLRIAGGETGRRLRVLAETFQPPDHPWIVQIPESLYLKSVLVEAA